MTPPVAELADSPRRFGFGGCLRVVLGSILASTGLAWGVLLTAARWWPPSNGITIILTGLAPWALPAFVIAVLGFAMMPLGRRVLVPALVLSLSGLAAQVVWLAPSYVGSHASGTPNLTVMELNLRFGGADANETVGLARRTGAEIVVLTEVTPLGLLRLDRAGLSGMLPYNAGAPSSDQSGTMIFSRLRLGSAKEIPTSRGGYLVRVAGSRPFWLVAVHADQPLSNPAVWRSDLTTVGTTVGALTGRRLVVGDLNATLDHAPMQQILGMGLSDAARAANSGWQPTWPRNIAFTVPKWVGVMAIDHVLVSSEFGVVSTHTYDIAGSDHRALVAGLIE